MWARWHDFQRNYLNELIHRNILIEVQYKGRGHQRRFKLGIGFDDLKHAQSICKRKYDAILDELTRK